MCPLEMFVLFCGAVFDEAYVRVECCNEILARFGVHGTEVK